MPERRAQRPRTVSGAAEARRQGAGGRRRPAAGVPRPRPRQRVGEVRFRVAMRDMDSVNIYYATYYEWMDRATCELFGRAGHPISDVFATGFAIPVVHSSCTYLAPVRMDELLCVQSWVSDVGRSSFRITHRFARESDGVPVAWGRVTHVWAKRPEMAAVTPPSWFQALASARGGAGSTRRMP